MSNRFCYVYYSSSLSPDGYHSYTFWFHGAYIQIRGDKPFARGDIVEIVDVSKGAGSFWTIEVKVLGTPSLDEEVDPDLPGKIPVLMLLSTKIYVGSDTDYHAEVSGRGEILIFTSTTYEGNKAYASAILVWGHYATLLCTDKVHGDQFQWVIKAK
jgi:hypothetical protein